MKAARAAMLLLAGLALLAGCAPRTSVRVDPAPPRRGPVASVPAAGEYQVARGDTLYGIAFRHGMDYRRLAQLNRIGPPYTIYPGQRLRLADDPRAEVRRPATPAGAGVVAQTVRPGASAPAPQPAGASNTGSAARPAAGQTGPAPVGQPATTQPTTTQPATPQPAPTQPPALATGPIRWRWPAEGQLAGRFVANDPTRQGLSIAGNAGQAVKAAADGVVVYSGSGLIGYGELIIIKHSEEWLSAYGHNRKRLVGEGQMVRGGDQIAEMGRSGASRDMLHFEIRRNGRPVDPLGLLPAAGR
jgi:lipoprotein NlpD